MAITFLAVAADFRHSNFVILKFYVKFISQGLHLFPLWLCTVLCPCDEFTLRYIYTVRYSTVFQRQFAILRERFWCF